MPLDVEGLFSYLHSASEALYDGDGHWGEHAYGYRMMLRDSYWRADVYGALCGARIAASDVYCARRDDVIAYLVRSQTEGGTGVFGIPAELNNPEFGSDILRVTKECPSCIQNGWVVNLPSDKISELYYDHGYALTSVARAYLASGNSSLLPVIRRAADWTLDKPLTRNVNYLSALAKGLIYAYVATGDSRYLEHAVSLHLQGIFPFQTDTGDWGDPHNARLVYHGFIVSGLIALSSQLPSTHPARAKLDQVLGLALSRMAERDLTTSPDRTGWPGTNVQAWLELSALRPLTTHEEQALTRSMQFMLDAQPDIEKSEGFSLRKKLYLNFFAGLYLARPKGMSAIALASRSDKSD